MAKEQALLPNGMRANDVAFERTEFGEHPGYFMGTVHVWVWRRTRESIEILVQKRAMSKKTHPGMFDISIAGHIDQGEEAIETAIRESREEMGLEINGNKLEFAFSLRKTSSPNVIAAVYLYEVDSPFIPSFDDGEVDSAKWVDIEQFRQIVLVPDEHNLVNHGTGYYVLLIERLDRV